MRTGELVNCRIPGCLMSIKHVHRGKKQTSRKVDFSESLGRWDAYLGMVQPFVGPIWSNVWVTSISSPFIWIGRVVCFCMVLCCFVFCFRIYCFVFQPGAVFLVFWCILKLKSLICVLFAALLELSFWLLVFGFGFTWFLAFGFWFLVFIGVYWFYWFLLVFVGFCWPVALVSLGFWFLVFGSWFHFCWVLVL